MSAAIEARLVALEMRVAALEAARHEGTKGKPAAPRAASEGQAPPATSGVAPDRDLDGQYGDPVVRTDPKRWAGESFVNRPFSACPPDYLDLLAGFLDWRAEREASTPGKEKYERYSRADAARARGWARRIRGGWQAPTETDAYVPPESDEAPF